MVVARAAATRRKQEGKEERGGGFKVVCLEGQGRRGKLAWMNTRAKKSLVTITYS